MILVYSPKTSNRIAYAAGLLLGSLLGAEWRLTNDAKTYANYEGPKINYSKQSKMREGLHIPAHGFLLERGVHFFLPEMIFKYRLPLLFPMTGKYYNLPFDPFSAAFYLVSRYEEYLPHTRDRFGRFEAEESYAFRNNFLGVPVVNHYAMLIRKRLQKMYPAYPFASPAFQFVPTYDVDVAFAYKGRSILRSFLGILRSTGKLDFHSLKQRIRVLTGTEKDPYDTYEDQLQLYKNSGIRAFFFFLCGNYGPYDRNVAFFSGNFISLVKKMGDYGHVGIHPSYASNDDEALLQTELKRLSNIVNHDIQYSRQHYLKLAMPGTYQNLLKNNVTHDFTMGYATQPGFRAGICSPYPFYDIETEKETPLTIVPFTVMDGTLHDYLKLSPGEAFTVVKRLINEVEKVNGSFVTLWHNDSLCDCGDWKGWKELYEKIYWMAAGKALEKK